LQAKRPKVAFLTDEPIVEPSQDRLGHSLYVDRVQTMVLAQDASHPLNIGLFGKWGSGKTGILNLLGNRIRNDEALGEKAEFVYIDAWRFSRGGLRQEILVELNRKLGRFSPEEIEDRLFNIREEKTVTPASEPWNRRIERIIVGSTPYLLIWAVAIALGILLKVWYSIDLLAPIATLILIPLLLEMIDKLSAATAAVRKSQKRIIPQASSPQEFHDLLCETLTKLKSERIIIAIDNLDRCESDIAVEMLGHIKSMMEIPRCFYLIACDNEALQKHLDKTRRFEGGDAREFLRKFFQISIPVPPLIGQEFEDYVAATVGMLDIEFGEPVKEILIAAAWRNPRRVKQFLNRLVVAYRIAEAREAAGILSKGAVTSNTGFLAKIVVLEEDWPEFFGDLEKNEELLSEFERYFMGEVQEVPKQIDPDLMAFLRGTRIVTAGDLGPFLKLTQESYESSISDLSAFKYQLVNGAVEDIEKRLRALAEDKREPYFRELLKVIHTCSTQGKSGQLFNCLNVVLAIRDLAPANLVSRIDRSFETHVFDPLFVKSPLNLRRLDVQKVFTLLPQISARSKNRLICLYGGLLLVDKKMDLDLLKLFLSNRDALGDAGVISVNDALISLLDTDEEQFHKVVVENILTDENLIRDVVQQRLVSKIVTDIKPLTDEAKRNARLNFFLRVKAYASNPNKAEFVRILLGIMTLRETTALEPHVRNALEKLMVLNDDDIPSSVREECINVIAKLSGRIADYGEKLRLLRFVVKHIRVFDRSRTDSILKPFVDAAPPNMVLELVKSARELDAPILSSNVVLESLGTRVARDIPDQNLIEYLAEGTPAELKNQLSKLFVGLVQTNDPRRFGPALAAVVKKKDSFSKEELDTISVACVKTARGLGVPQAATLIEPVLALIPHTSDVSGKVLTDLIIEWIKSDDANTRNTGCNSYRKVRDLIASERRMQIAHQVIAKIQSMSDRIDQASVLIDLIVEDWGLVEEQYRNCSSTR
jgi:hypothetical protein